MNIDFKTAEWKDILDCIDQHYVACKGICGRLDPHWGAFSVKMNTSIRKRVQGFDAGDPERDKYVWLFAYWVYRSQLLDLYMKSGILVQGKVKKLVRKAKKFRRAVITGIGPKMSEATLLKTLLGKV